MWFFDNVRSVTNLSDTLSSFLNAVFICRNKEITTCLAFYWFCRSEYKVVKKAYLHEDSNQVPSAYMNDTLPTELPPQNDFLSIYRHTPALVYIQTFQNLEFIPNDPTSLSFLSIVRVNILFSWWFFLKMTWLN